MDMVTTLSPVKNSSFPMDCAASELNNIFQHLPASVKVLSLDCFDTIIMRKVVAPIDVFFDLQHQDNFKKIGFHANLRIRGEHIARRKKKAECESSEVNLKDIYLTNYPILEEEQLSALAEEELSEEMKQCYPFLPMLDFIREAKQRNLKIIIMSDTYFNEAQLRRLLAHTLPQEVLACIDDIFCSSDMGKSKSDGLFNQCLKKLGITPQAVLHIGDHPLADYRAPKEQGIYAIQLKHHGEKLKEILRMQANAACLFDPSIRQHRSCAFPFLGILSSYLSHQPSAASTIGYTSLGPIMYAFAQYITQELDKLKQAKKTTKIAFLLRDAYLPFLSCEALLDATLGHCVRISRFTAFAASFCSKKEVDAYLGENVASLRFADMCRQLLIPEALSSKIIKQCEGEKQAALIFTRCIHQPNILKTIFEESKKYRQRLIRYLQKSIQLQRGDTLLFVDLGYSGTAQRLLAPVFKREFEVDIVGCYLLSLRIPEIISSRSGLIDPHYYDDRALLTTVNYMALFEQLTTTPEQSVIDFDDEGEPIFTQTAVGIEQHHKISQIQEECIRFIRDAQAYYRKLNAQPLTAQLRDTAMAALNRLLFFLTQEEINYLKSFEFDLNLGTSDILKLFDEKKGLTGLKRRGLFFMEQNLKTMRTNYPAELRVAGLDLSLAFLSQSRFGLRFSAHELSYLHESLTVLIMRNHQSSQSTIEALATRDGYYSLAVPLGKGNFQAGILFGERYTWVQIESMELIDAQYYMTAQESEHVEDAMNYLCFDGMEHQEEGLFHCLSANSFVLVNPPQKKSDFLLRIVFRPIAYIKQ